MPYTQKEKRAEIKEMNRIINATDLDVTSASKYAEHKAKRIHEIRERVKKKKRLIKIKIKGGKSK